MEVLQFSKISTLSRVDATNGIIYGVSVITLGEAKGHAMQIDEKTLTQFLATAKTHKDGIKVKFGDDHKAGVDAVTGSLKNFSLDGSHIRADLHLLKSDEHYDKILEMSVAFPDEFGLSAVFSGDHETVGRDKFARCSEIYSVDLVSDPAANKSLFSAKTNTPNMKSIALALGLPETATEQEIEIKAKEIAALAAKKKLSDEDDEKKKKEDEEKKKLEEKEEADKKEMSALKAQIVELSAKFAAIEGGKKVELEAAHKASVDALISEASKEGKVCPASETLYKLSLADAKTLLAGLPKGQVNLGGEGKKAEFKKLEGDALKAFCIEQRAKGATELNEKYKSLVS